MFAGYFNRLKNFTVNFFPVVRKIYHFLIKSICGNHPNDWPMLTQGQADQWVTPVNYTRIKVFQFQAHYIILIFLFLNRINTYCLHERTVPLCLPCNMLSDFFRGISTWPSHLSFAFTRSFNSNENSCEFVWSFKCSYKHKIKALINAECSVCDIQKHN